MQAPCLAQIRWRQSQEEAGLELTVNRFPTLHGGVATRRADQYRPGHMFQEFFTKIKNRLSGIGRFADGNAVLRDQAIELDIQMNN
ncbi:MULTISPECIES: hypothetical protein [Chromobacterium]|uniref:Uncharacterized protein n=1 Tax=Chromobacterium aquaticum TaxID=467180 RepID=A0ABV8ZVB0_9NEIS|nr:hypothetical protein [Chromobacterium aquaticum]MCD5364156.1 hypothetical protein [Chromobacterium aquaticum]